MNSEIGNRQNLSRRKFLKYTTAATGVALTGAPLAPAARRVKTLPKPQFSGIEHIIVVCMENRSFDHFTGWIPGADGHHTERAYTDETGVAYSTYPLAPGNPLVDDYQGCSHPDPDHSYQGGRIEYNNGSCDGWLRAGNNDTYAIGYYTQNNLPFFAGAVNRWTSCDRYFSAIMAGTYPNRLYLNAAQTDRLSNTIDISTLPTIWDRLADKSLRARYYFSDVPFLGLWGLKYLPILRHVSEFYADCAAGTLPAVSYVDPRLLGEQQGLSNDDHPHADIRNGQVFLNEIYTAVTTSPNWPNTVLVITYDEWGGFFDHVAPTTAPIPPASAAAGDTDGLRGFRVPTFIISPWSPAGVSHAVFDHTSILKMIEWRWHIEPLTVRDATANNLAMALDFRSRNMTAPAFGVPPGPFGVPCGLPEIVPNKWDNLAVLAQALGII
jgi:phospholipase C